MVKSRACSSHVRQLGKRPPRSARGAEAVSSSGSRLGVALVQTQRHLGPFARTRSRQNDHRGSGIGTNAVQLLGLFLLGAVISPLGDHIHVPTGTTTYFDRTFPFVWDSPLWFSLAVGLGTAALAEIRARFGSLRSRPDVRWAEPVSGVSSRERAAC